MSTSGWSMTSRATSIAKYYVHRQQPQWSGEEPCMAAPDVFHPDKFDSRAEAIAKWMCRRCPMKEPCLEWALTDPTLMGVHGGKTAKERVDMKRPVS